MTCPIGGETENASHTEILTLPAHRLFEGVLDLEAQTIETNDPTANQSRPRKPKLNKKLSLSSICATLASNASSSSGFLIRLLPVVAFAIK